MNLEEVFGEVEHERAALALQQLLQKFLDPAFGALPKSEVELLMLNALEQIGAVSPEPGVYELVSKLRVTRTKARKLIYERELRRLSPSELDRRVKELIKRPLIQKSGEMFVLEIENPLISDHLRAKVQQLGHISDGSFSPSLVKLPLDAIVALIELYLTEDEIDAVKAALIEAGAPDTSFRGVVKSVLKSVAKKIASDTGEALMDNASEYLSPLMEGATAELTEKIAELFVDHAE